MKATNLCENRRRVKCLWVHSTLHAQYSEGTANLHAHAAQHKQKHSEHTEPTSTHTVGLYTHTHTTNNEFTDVHKHVIKHS